MDKNIELLKQKEDLEKELSDKISIASNLIGDDKINEFIRTKRYVKKEYKTVKKEYKNKKKQAVKDIRIRHDKTLKKVLISGFILISTLPACLSGVSAMIDEEVKEPIYTYTIYSYQNNEKELENYESTEKEDYFDLTLKSPFHKEDGKYKREIYSYHLDCSKENITVDTLDQFIEQGYDYIIEELKDKEDKATYEYKINIDEETLKEDKGEINFTANVIEEKEEAPQDAKIVFRKENTKKAIFSFFKTSIIIASGINCLFKLFTKEFYFSFILDLNKTIKNVEEYEYDFNRKEEKRKMKALKKEYKSK